MASCKSIYDPQEDSTMLEACVKMHAFGKVLDIGTGSGIQAIAAAHKQDVSSVLATDIQRGVIDYCKKNIKNKKIRFIQSDLFRNVKGKFDTIIFNPPYLPQDLQLKDLTTEGGKKGYEVIEKFLNDANNFLNPNGIILMVFSSLTKKAKVEELIKNSLLDFRELEKQHIFFEDIYVYLLSKKEFLKILENNGIRHVRYLTKGHRGLLFTGIYRNRKIAIKTKNPTSTAVGRIENEAKWLKKLNKYKIGPKVIFTNEFYFAYNYIDGGFVLDYFKKSSANIIKKTIKNIFSQMFVLDRLKIEKMEMHHPLKHIIIEKNKPVLIDFERAHYSSEPKNVTQFCQFLINQKTAMLLRDKNIIIDRSKMLDLAKIYKSAQNQGNFRKIAGLI